METRDIHSIIKELCVKKGIPISNLGKELEKEYGEVARISKAAISEWKGKNGSQLKAQNLKAIAEYFGVPVEYLLGTEVQSHTIKDNHGVIGNTHAPVTIVNGSERTLSDGEVELLRVFNSLDVKRQTSLLTFAFGLEEEIEYSMAARGAEGVVKIHNKKEKKAIDRAFDTADDK